MNKTTPLEISKSEKVKKSNHASANSKIQKVKKSDSACPIALELLAVANTQQTLKPSLGAFPGVRKIVTNVETVGHKQI